MSQKNVLNVYYKGTSQKFKYYGNFDEKSIKETIRLFFRIKEPVEDIYFQDEDGDFVILNEETPSGVSVYIYVEKDAKKKYIV